MFKHDEGHRRRLILLGITILFTWAPSSGPVVGYEVEVGGRYVGKVAAPMAYLDFGFSPVSVRAFDEFGNTGPWSEPSEPMGIPHFQRLRNSYPR